jgi:hypothetical protein
VTEAWRQAAQAEKVRSATVIELVAAMADYDVVGDQRHLDKVRQLEAAVNEALGDEQRAVEAAVKIEAQRLRDRGQHADAARREQLIGQIRADLVREIQATLEQLVAEADAGIEARQAELIAAIPGLRARIDAARRGEAPDTDLAGLEDQLADALNAQRKRAQHAIAVMQRVYAHYQETVDAVVAGDVDADIDEIIRTFRDYLDQTIATVEELLAEQPDAKGAAEALADLRQARDLLDFQTAPAPPRQEPSHGRGSPQRDAALDAMADRRDLESLRAMLGMVNDTAANELELHASMVDLTRYSSDPVAAGFVTDQVDQVREALGEVIAVARRVLGLDPGDAWAAGVLRDAERALANFERKLAAGKPVPGEDSGLAAQRAELAASLASIEADLGQLDQIEPTLGDGAEEADIKARITAERERIQAGAATIRALIALIDQVLGVPGEEQPAEGAPEDQSGDTAKDTHEGGAGQDTNQATGQDTGHEHQDTGDGATNRLAASGDQAGWQDDGAPAPGKQGADADPETAGEHGEHTVPAEVPGTANELGAEVVPPAPATGAKPWRPEVEGDGPADELTAAWTGAQTGTKAAARMAPPVEPPAQGGCGGQGGAAPVIAMCKPPSDQDGTGEGGVRCMSSTGCGGGQPIPDDGGGTVLCMSVGGCGGGPPIPEGGGTVLCMSVAGCGGGSPIPEGGGTVLCMSATGCTGGVVLPQPGGGVRCLDMSGCGGIGVLPGSGDVAASLAAAWLDGRFGAPPVDLSTAAARCAAAC